MSGITAIIGSQILDATLSATHIEAMIGCMRQSSDGGGTVGSVREETVLFHGAWTRRSDEATCIAWNSRRDIGLIFIGEDFDIAAKAAKLRRPHESTGSDAECLLQLYEQSGVRFLREINGWFAGVVIDLRTRTVLLFNDRYGLNRIYIHSSQEALYFSSQAKSLLSILSRLRRLDPRGVAELFSVGCVMQNRSLFDGISILPPGSCWTFNSEGNVTKSRYFDPAEWENQEKLTPEEYSAQLCDVVRRIVPKYLRDAARVGMSLTGGLDSRMILAWIGAQPGSLPCYTFGGPYRDCADVKIAKQLARSTGQAHTTVRIGNDFFDDFPHLAEQTVYTTDGCMDVSGAVELYVNRRARCIKPVRLTGNYGSEILRSNVAFRPAKMDRSLFTVEFQQHLDEAESTYRAEADAHRLSFIAFKQVPWHHYSRYAAEKSQLTPRSPFLDIELVALAYRAPKSVETSAKPLLDLIRKGNPALEAIRTDRALQARAAPVIGSISRNWQEFTAKAEYAYDYGMPPWLSRADRTFKALRLERLFLGRHKFYHFRIWYRDQLGEFVRSQIHSGACASCYIEGAAVNIQLHSPRNIHTSICGIDGLLGKMWEVVEEVVTDAHRGMCLIGAARKLPGDFHVCAIPIWTAEGIARQRTWLGANPSENHPAVQATCK